MGRRPLLALGDGLVILLVTAVGFATHGELGTAPLGRLLATLLPLALGWALAAPWLGLFDPAVTGSPRMLWRPAYAMLLAGPLAAFLRGVALNSVILPIFVAAFTLSSAFAMTLWRALWLLLARPRSATS